MAIEMTERISFLGQSQINFIETQEKLDQLHKLKQEVDDRLSLVTEKVEVNVNFKPPIRIIPISDTHLFSVQTDIDKVNEIFDKLNEENTYGIVMGDIIEGANPRITDHIGNVELDFGKQIEAAKERVRPYIAAGKIFCMSTTYNGHEGWGSRYLGIDVVELIARDLKKPDGTPLRVLVNGGRFVIHFSNGETHSEIIYHAPGGGGSDEINILGAQRNRLWEFISHRGPIDGAGGGDWHHRAGASKELTVNLKTGKEESPILYSNGTTKGNDPNRTDSFLTKMAKGPTSGPGVQLIFNQQKREKNDGRNGEYAWATYGYNKGEILYEAAKLWDKTERQGKTSGLVEEVIKNSVSPKVDFDRRNSRTKVKDNRFDTPMYESFRWRVEASDSLPLAVYLFANTRYSSTSFEKRDREKFLKMLKKIEKNPFRYGLMMRHVVDPDVAEQFDRDEVLDRMIEDLTPAASEGRLLGFMMSASLLNEKWKKSVFSEWHNERHRNKKGQWEYVRVREEKGALLPGDEIYAGLDRRVPLYLNQSVMTMDFGNGVSYEFLLMDHLSGSGSEFDMFRGLVQARRKNLASSDIVAGGHMPGAGFMTTPDATYIAPGWFSEYDSRGKANTKRAPLGGQGVILLPDTKMVIPASTFLEATDIHTALMLERGLKKEEKEKLLYKTKR